jgi:hypothetical protein
MIPFCRTVDEAKKVLKVMEEGGLKRGKDGLEVYLMCEIPANVILADQFLDLVDGYSLGTNDLTQLTLGLDRDSELVSSIYDERNQAVKDLVATVINKCRERGKYIGICGQAPSDYPEFAEFVVECGIETMSLNPDTIVKTKMAIAELEHKLSRRKTQFNPGFNIKSYHKSEPDNKSSSSKKSSSKKVSSVKKSSKTSVSKKSSSSTTKKKIAPKKSISVKKSPAKKTKVVEKKKTPVKKATAKKSSAVKKAPVKKATKKPVSKKTKK